MKIQIVLIKLFIFLLLFIFHRRIFYSEFIYSLYTNHRKLNIIYLFGRMPNRISQSGFQKKFFTLLIFIIRTFRPRLITFINGVHKIDTCIIGLYNKRARHSCFPIKAKQNSRISRFCQITIPDTICVPCALSRIVLLPISHVRTHRIELTECVYRIDFATKLVNRIFSL